MLHFGSRPPISSEKFISQCEELIPQKDAETLKRTIRLDGIDESAHPTLKKWLEFDAILRNELVRVRSPRLHRDPEKYLRASTDSYSHTQAMHTARASSRNPSVLEAERMLDVERWRVLSDLQIGHYFDLDFLLIYAIKLSIVERWEKIDMADVPGVLADTLAKGR